jgi:aminopeptidase N
MTTTDVPTAPLVHHREDYAPTPYLIDEVELEFHLDPRATRVLSTLHLRRNPAAPAEGADLVLDGEELEHLSAELDGRVLRPDEYVVEDNRLVLPSPPERFTLRTEVRIDPTANTELSGLYRSGGNFCTQCEAEGFRRITWYLDRPDVMARFTTYIEGDRSENPVLLSNGNPVGRGELEGGRHWARWEDPFKKPSYLFALVAGQLACHEDTFTARSGREIRLEIYTEPQNAGKTAHAMESLKRSMKWDEDVFGLEYDLDQYMIVAVDDFNMGAMENKGLNVFNSTCVLADPQTATDTNYAYVEAVIAHEYFHNWTGNRVTCRDWFQLTLKEGLTVFRDQQFSGDMNSSAVERIANVRNLRGRQFAEDAGPMAHPIRPESYIEMNNFYTATVYEKGSEVIRMYHTLLGAEGFRKGMDLYFERHDGQAVTCDDFRAAMADANGVDLSQFERWYLQAGTPRLVVRTSHDPAAGTFTVTLRQRPVDTPDMPAADKLPYHMPVRVGLLSRSGAPLSLQLEGEAAPGETSRVLELRELEQSFTFTGLPEEPVLSVLRDFSAPVIVEHDRPDADYAFLMAHDEDAFNRWDAGQLYGTKLLLEGVAAHQRGEAWELPQDFVAALAKTLADPELDRSLKALALSLPGEAWLADRMEVADPVAVHRVREAARRQVAEALRAELFAAIDANQTPGAYQFSVEAVGRRDLSNLALSYLMTLEDEDALALCVERFSTATNMTDSLAALTCLADRDIPEREEALARFHERWKHEPLVVNKWFTVQAGSDLPDATERVRALTHHPDFTLKNPNRARSLVGAFATGNPAAFHAEDGEGYRFLADQVIAMDGINPQIASRLVDPLLAWRRYGPSRQERLKAELQRILDTPKLSRDVYEKVSKAAS